VNRESISLRELASRVKAVIDRSFAAVSFWVVGDVASLVFRGENNSYYFDLVEKDPRGSGLLAKFSCNAWGKAVGSIENFERITGQRFENNIQILACVRVQFHEQYGLKLTLLDINPSYTLGLLERKRQETLENLVKNNPTYIKTVGDSLVTFNQQVPLNIVIQKVAVVSSASSAGLQDFRHSLENNSFGYNFDVDLFHSEVQGENYLGIVDRLMEIKRGEKKYDVVAIIRGGGSQTDFLIFDNYHIAAEVARMPIPVITGIGHQKNESIVDLMAHTSTKTPTKVAELIIAHNRNFEERVIKFQHSIVVKTQQILGKRSKELEGSRHVLINGTRSGLMRHHKVLNNLASKMGAYPRFIIDRKEKELASIVSRIKNGSGHVFRSKARDLEHLRTMVRVMSPESILRKGYAIIKKEGRIIVDPDQLRVGEKIEIVLGEKEIGAEVKKISDKEG
jgi:exodeoxyribonuclease VII large subunit